MKTMKFVAKVVVLALVVAILIAIPQIVTAIWTYMSTDAGYMWVVNMTIAIVIAIIVFWIFSTRWPAWATWTLSVIIFLVTVMVCEALIWHPADIGEIIATKITVTKVVYVLLGIAFSAIIYRFEHKGKVALPEDGKK